MNSRTINFGFAVLFESPVLLEYATLTICLSPTTHYSQTLGISPQFPTMKETQLSKLKTQLPSNSPLIPTYN